MKLTIKSAVRTAIMLSAGILISFQTSSQVSSYTFAQSVATYTAVTGGTVLGDTANNDNSFANLNIGFTFYYNGQSYTQFGVNANGYIGFGNIGFSSFTVLSSNFNTNVISALNYDLQGQAGSEIQYRTTGTAPNRTLIVQWKGYRSAAATGDNLNFQIRLNETSNSIDIRYGVCTSTIAKTSQTGIKGNNGTDYSNRYVSDTVNTWATSTAGTALNSTCKIGVGFNPVSGQTYLWTPVPPAAPTTLTFTSISVTGLTVNWIDNSTNENSFVVYKSTDNITYTIATTVASTSSATTGNAYSYSLSGLNSGTLYYFRIFSNGSVPSVTSLNGNTPTLSGTICGTFKIGPTGTYPSIKSAISAIQANGLSCSVILELQAAYTSFADSFPVQIPFLGASSTKTLTLRPETGATGKLLNAASSQILDFNGASWFILDGRAGGTGSTSNLELFDSSATGSALRFINDAQNNIVTYVSIKGASSGGQTSGVIQFSNAATTGGNSNNTITNCDITQSSASPQTLLYSNTNVGSNNSNTVSNCKFHDWYFNGVSNYGMNLGTGNSAWTITGNSFYQAVAQTYVSGNNTMGAINISGGQGVDYNITGNFIGGSLPNCGGAAWTINGTAGPRFNGISLNGGTSGTSEVHGNTIRNISLTTNAAAGGGPGGGGNTIFNGIIISGGNVNLGTTTPNIIGSNSAANSIVTIAAISGAQTVGINCSSQETVSIVGNIVGGIFANDSAATISTSCVGILASAGIVSIRNNAIGSSTVANSITNAASNGTGNNSVIGISSGNTTSSTISGNTVRNIANICTGTGNVVARGISATGGVNSIASNIVDNISCFSPQNGVGLNSSVTGILQSSNQPIQAVIGNSIRLLSNKSNTGNVGVTGLYYSGANTGVNVIEKNRIYGLSAPLDTSVATITGVHINNGSTVIVNNMITIGTDTSGVSSTSANEYNGILKSGNGANKFYFNSVNIAGTGVTSRVVNSYGFKRTVTGLDTLQNNIFANNRSNTFTGGSHYSISLNNDSIFSGKNNLFGNGNGYMTGLLNATNANSLFDWFTAAHVDSNSLAVNPNFLSAVNIHINSAFVSSLESAGYTIAGYATDYDNDVRPGPIGSIHGGATAPDIGADEFDGSLIAVDMGTYALVKPTIGCHSATDSVIISIKNYSSLLIDFSLNPLAVHVSASGVNPVTFPITNITTGTLAAGATMNVVITNSYNMSALGSYIFNAYAVTTGDMQATNDTLSSVTIQISGGSATPSRTTLCSGLPVTLSLAGQTNGASIQWQVSTNNINWSNVAGAVNPTVTVTPSVNSYYRALTCGIYNSNVDTVTLVSVGVPTAVTGATRCGVGSVTLHATSPNLIAWFDSLSGGNLLDTGAAFITNVTASRAFYAAASGNVSAAKSITTTFAGPNNSGGIMFTITAISNVTVTGFDGQSGTGTNTWGIYFRRDNFLNVPGSNTNPAGWTFVDSASNVVSAGAGLPTTIPINMSVLIPAGKTYSFYVMAFSGPNVIYSIGTGLGNSNASNTELQVKDGYAGQTFNCTTSPRVFNGNVRYKTSCLSNRVAANVIVTAPTAINAIAATSTICEGDSVHLTVTSTNANYRYTWTSSAQISSSTGASVYGFPTGSSAFYVQATDSVSGCSNLDTVSVTGHQLPSINITASSDSVCAGDTVNLNVNLPLSYPIGNGFGSNNSTTYPAPYGNSSFGARHQILILADEMIASGMVPGYLNSLSFQVTNTNGGGDLSNFTIKIGNTVKTALTDTFQTSTMTTVYTSALYTPVAGVNTHAFSAPFHWNGLTNILIETCFNNTTATVNARMRQTNTSYNSCTHYHTDSLNNCTHTTGTAVNQRPLVIFGIRNQFTAHWTSNQVLSNANSLTPYSIPSATDVFYVTVTDSITGCMNKDSITITVDSPPIVNLGNDTSVCGSILLNAGNPGDTYLWNDSSQSRTLLADTTGIYSVTVTHLGSCISADAINVIVNSLPVVSLSLAFDTICSGDGIRTLSGGSPANGTFSGTGVTGNNFDPNAAGAGFHLITYTYMDLVSGCSNTATDFTLVNICAGVNELGRNSLIKVFPNPASGEFTIDLTSITEKCFVKLMTPESQIIMSTNLEGSSLHTISLDNLSNGIYFLQLSTKNDSYIVRLVKQN